MKTFITKAMRFALIICFSLLSIDAFAQCEEAIKNFYVTYMQNVEKCDDKANELLKQAHMSPELIATLAEYTEQYDADAIIHAQDVNKYAIESLNIVPMPDNCYLVKYKWSPDARETLFPIQAVCEDGKLKILNIFPVGTDNNGQSYIKKKPASKAQ